jgi:molybdenum-dependent DNA-binding transcriptional regulator ModE
MSLSYDDVAIFLNVARAGSFVGAARSLRMPVSTVSRRVAALEARLKTQLLRRTTRAVSLTDDGRAFADRCGQAVEEIEAAAEQPPGKAPKQSRGQPFKERAALKAPARKSRAPSGSEPSVRPSPLTEPAGVSSGRRSQPLLPPRAARAPFGSRLRASASSDTCNMIRKKPAPDLIRGGNRIFEKIMLKQKAGAGCRSNHNSSRSRIKHRQARDR